MQWTQTYSVNVSELDEQHKGIIDLINQGLLLSGKSHRIKTGKIIKKIFEYTEFHFTTEEKYFNKFDFSETEAHMEQHRLLTEKMFEFKQKFDDHEIDSFSEVIDLLRRWWDDHLLSYDKSYVKCFNSHGLY